MTTPTNSEANVSPVINETGQPVKPAGEVRDVSQINIPPRPDVLIDTRTGESILNPSIPQTSTPDETKPVVPQPTPVEGNGFMPVATKMALPEDISPDDPYYLQNKDEFKILGTYPDGRLRVERTNLSSGLGVAPQEGPGYNPVATETWVSQTIQANDLDYLNNPGDYQIVGKNPDGTLQVRHRTLFSGLGLTVQP